MWLWFGRRSSSDVVIIISETQSVQETFYNLAEMTETAPNSKKYIRKIELKCSATITDAW